jgi:hypothetical protein
MRFQFPAFGFAAARFDEAGEAQISADLARSDGSRPGLHPAPFFCQILQLFLNAYPLVVQPYHRCFHLDPIM